MNGKRNISSSNLNVPMEAIIEATLGALGNAAPVDLDGTSGTPSMDLNEVIETLREDRCPEETA